MNEQILVWRVSYLNETEKNQQTILQWIVKAKNIIYRNWYLNKTLSDKVKIIFI